jgi:hypothetical protein
MPDCVPVAVSNSHRSLLAMQIAAQAKLAEKHRVVLDTLDDPQLQPSREASG